MKYGWRGIGLPDQRDAFFSYKAVMPTLPEIPKVKYLICAQVVDQGDLGACVFFALSYALEAMQVARDEVPINPSQLYAYYRYRELYGNVNSDDGAFIRDAIKTYAEGVCLEKVWPYLIANFAKQPPARAYQEAQEHQIQSYHAIYTQEDMLQCLASDYGFVGGISCYESFDSLATERTGIVNLPGAQEKLLGGHALYFCGYDLHKGVLHFQNSYSKSWGKEGFGIIPIEYLTNSRLAGDIWTIRS